MLCQAATSSCSLQEVLHCVSNIFLTFFHNGSCCYSSRYGIIEQYKNASMSTERVERRVELHQHGSFPPGKASPLSGVLVTIQQLIENTDIGTHDPA